MGKVSKFLTIVIFIDLFFIITGQLGNQSISSIIFDSILNFQNITGTELFKEFIGDIANLASSTVGFLALLATGGVIVGAFIATKEFRILLIPITFTLALVAGDLITINLRLIEANAILASLIMIPLTIIYIFSVVEWLKGSD